MTFDSLVGGWGLLAIGALGVALAVPWFRPSRLDVAPTARRLVLAGLLTLLLSQPALARPEPTSSARSDVDVLVMLDTTNSMLAEDYHGNRPRLVGARHDVRELTRSLPGARFALVTFDSRARLEMPFTTDSSALVSAVDVASPPPYYYAHGSSVTAGVPVARDYLTRAAAESPARTRVVVYLGDGEHTAQAPPDSLASLRRHIDAAVVLGYGTHAGGPMREAGSAMDTPGYIGDTGPGDHQLSRIDEERLRTIADQLGARYAHRTSATSLAPAVDPLTDIGSESAGGRATAAGTPVSWMVALALGVVLVVELACTVLAAPRRRESR